MALHIRPKIVLPTDGPGANVYALVRDCRSVMRDLTATPAQIEAFSEEALTQPTYDDVKRFIEQHFEVEWEGAEEDVGA